MLEKLKQKAPHAPVIQADITKYTFEDKFDYIFIPSGSISLFTDMHLCKTVLRRLKEWLLPGGQLVFAVDTVADQCPDASEYKVSVSIKTKEDLISS